MILHLIKNNAYNVIEKSFVYLIKNIVHKLVKISIPLRMEIIILKIIMLNIRKNKVSVNKKIKNIILIKLAKLYVD